MVHVEIRTRTSSDDAWSPVERVEVKLGEQLRFGAHRTSRPADGAREHHGGAEADHVRIRSLNVAGLSPNDISSAVLTIKVTKAGVHAMGRSSQGRWSLMHTGQNRVRETFARHDQSIVVLHRAGDYVYAGENVSGVAHAYVRVTLLDNIGVRVQRPRTDVTPDPQGPVPAALENLRALHFPFDPDAPEEPRTATQTGQALAAARAYDELRVDGKIGRIPLTTIMGELLPGTSNHAWRPGKLVADLVDLAEEQGGSADLVRERLQLEPEWMDKTYSNNGDWEVLAWILDQAGAVDRGWVEDFKDDLLKSRQPAAPESP